MLILRACGLHLRIPEGIAMNNRIRQILAQIAALEEELNAAIKEQGGRLRYRFEGNRVVFEQAIRESHQRVKQGVLRWLVTIRPQNFLTMPVIYSMIVPLLLLDLCVSLYQLICFPVYRIARVRRANYIVMDHQHLSYLNAFEKVHCMYCSYAVGLLGYASEIIARTELYFCPIKHAGKILGAHAHYRQFLEYGEADDYHGKLENFRSGLAKEADQAGKPQTKAT